MANNYDFQIDSLKFRMAEQRNLPYLRTTAPFRKEQLDTSATVGDQSLTGWWTRGQLSFHRGAGLKYYEVLESENLLHRFHRSQYVRVFEVPGEADLDVRPTELFSGAETITKALQFLKVAMLGLTSGGDLQKVTTYPTVGSPTTVNFGVGVTVRDFSTIGLTWGLAVTSDNKVYKFGSLLTPLEMYTHTDALYSVWGGKGRVWVMSSEGDVFIKPEEPVISPAPALADPICRIAEYSAGDTVTWADGGGSVFMACSGNRIYSFTPENDGSLAVLSAPIVAGILPHGETVRAIEAHMGVLVIVTDRGTRFAAIDGASLTIGPLVAPWEAEASQCAQIGLDGHRVYTSGRNDSGDVVGYEFDLTEPLENNTLLFPYRLAFLHTAGSVTTAHGCTPHRNGVIWYAASSEVDPTCAMTDGVTELQPSGYLTTAYHRFGTLDSKRFFKILVRARGSGGTIAVAQVEADGTTTSLGSMNVATEKAKEFAIAETDAVESLAFKFTLTRSSSTVGPTLLGYQVKGLPVPERHRLLRVPLVIADYVSLRHGTREGTQGKGYADITALEALENSQAIVTFTDHRTGETGTAYIDQLEFQDNQPATYNDNGFGGFAYVTLRVLE